MDMIILIIFIIILVYVIKIHNKVKYIDLLEKEVNQCNKRIEELILKLSKK